MTGSCLSVHFVNSYSGNIELKGKISNLYKKLFCHSELFHL